MYNRSPKKISSNGSKLPLTFENYIIVQEKHTFSYKKLINLYAVHELDNSRINIFIKFIMKNSFYNTVKLTINASLSTVFMEYNLMEMVHKVFEVWFLVLKIVVQDKRHSDVR